MSALADTTNTTNQEVAKAAEVVASPEKATTIKTTTETNADPTITETMNVSENAPVDKKEEAKSDAPAEEVSASETPADAPAVATTAIEASSTEESSDEKKSAAEGVESPSQDVVEESETTQKESEEAPMEEVSPEEIKKKISENIIAGRRFMKVNSFIEATEVLSAAAALAAELFGEGHVDTFEVNFLYGKALLELAKIEDNVLNNALADIPKAADGDDVQDDFVENPDNVPQEERAEIKQKVEEALGVVSEEPELIEEDVPEVVEEKATEDDVTAGDQEAGSSDVAEDVDMEASEEQAGETQEADDEADSSDAEDEDEPMKLSWELLETSRCICEKWIKTLEAEKDVNTEEVKKWKLNLADVLMFLGEHGVVDSKYEQAQKDLTEAFDIQTAHLSSNSRVLAETKHQLAKAFSGNSLFEEAATHYTDSKNILIAKLEELKKQLESSTEENKEDIQLEINELEDIIPSLERLIIDARASAEQTEKVKADLKKELENAAAEIAKLSNEEPKDISNMVRRPTKRPASEEPKEEVKKRKSEDGAATVPDEKADETPTEESESAPAPVTQE